MTSKEIAADSRGAPKKSRGASIYSKVSYEDLWGISACLALALAAHLGSMPPWVLGTVVVTAAIRLVSARRGRGPPPRSVRLLVSAAAIALLFAQFHTFNGLAAGTALLALTAGLKVLETDTKRDIYIITLIIYFVGISALLGGESFWLLAYLISVCWLTTATLLRLTTPSASGLEPQSAIFGEDIGQALPVALVLWLLFPRFSGPLWHMPGDDRIAGSGLSDTMSPGDIDRLALSDEVAFRVHFTTAAPPSQERYWRGPVLHDFDGRTWRRSFPLSLKPPPLQPQGPAIATP